MKVIVVLLCIFILFIIFVVFESYREIRQLRITEYKISLNKLPKEFNGFKMILLADLHNCFYNNEKILYTIKNEKPNAVIISGDMVVYGDNQEFYNKQSIELIKAISDYSDVYYVPGNHEMGYMTKLPDEWLKYEKLLIEDCDNDNIFFMDNKIIELSRGDSSIKLYGLHLTDGYYKRFIKKPLKKDYIIKLLGESDSDKLNIMIAHNPDYFQDYCAWGADIVMSGHNHGGLIKIPFLGGVISPRLRIFPKYDYGLFNIGKSYLILTGGIGAHSLKIRVNNIPELVLINLNNDK